MKISVLSTDAAILTEMGIRISHRRLEMQLTQAMLAEQAGVAKRTLERLESGASGQLSSWIRILRVLDLLPGLDRLLPPAAPSPMEQLKRKGKPRRRARSRRPPEKTGAWSWDDDA